MPKQELLEQIVNTRDLPSPPGVVMALLNAIDEEDVNIGVLADKAMQDQALTAKVLRLANSPYFATQVKVTTIQQAITLLGFRNVSNLIVTAALTGCFPERRCPGFDHAVFWRHALTTATAAGILARHLGLHTEFAFTAGLLHDLGKLVLVSRFPESYSQAIAYSVQHDCPLSDAEREAFGICHAQAGEILAIHWNFSETIRLAIAAHHTPDLPGAGFLAVIVHAANAIAEQLESAACIDTGATPVLEMSTAVWDAMNLSEETFAIVVDETRAHFERIKGMTVV